MSVVSFTGLVGYPSDDINKFLWMVRIGGGVFPHIKEPDYLVSFFQQYSTHKFYSIRKKSEIHTHLHPSFFILISEVIGRGMASTVLILKPLQLC